MKREPPTCHACARPARRGLDGFCSDACRQAFAHEHELAPGRETVEMQNDRPHGEVWVGGRRLNLQNSA